MINLLEKSKKKISLKEKSKIAKSTNSVYCHKFFDIQCSYLCPSDLNHAFLAGENSEFVVFHNNVRSLCDGNNTTIGKIKDIFQNCSGQLPDLLAFSDTQVNDRSPVPSFDGFHEFEFTPTPIFISIELRFL